MQSTNNVTMGQIRRIAGDAGLVSYDVEVRDQDGSVEHFTFNGNIFVGPVMLTIRNQDGQWRGEVIEEPRRFGEYASPDWVRRYLERRAATTAYASD